MTQQHIADGMLQAYLDGELGPAERAGVAGHLAACAACAAQRLEIGRAHV